MQPYVHVFPKDAYLAFIKTLCPPGSTVFWKGDPEPFYAPLAEFDTHIVVRLDHGDSTGYGTNERRRCWDASANNGQGAYIYYNLQRMKWPVTIDVETLNARHPGEDFAMTMRNKLRWRSSIRAIQCIGLTTVDLSDVVSKVHSTADYEVFGSLLNISHGQCYWLQETDDPGTVIETVTTVTGTLTGGVPDPVDVSFGPITST